MQDAIKTEQVGPFTVELHYDEDGWTNDPREWSNVGTVVLPERRSVVGDAEREYQDDDGTWHVEYVEPGHEDYEQALAVELDAYALLPLRFDDYGSRGARLYVIDDRDWADANAYVWTDETSARRILGSECSHMTAEAAMRAEVKVLDQWVQGEVYGYVVKNDVGEHVDSCWGYIGEPDYAMSEGRELAEHLYDQAWAPAVEEQEVPARLLRNGSYVDDHGIVYDVDPGQTVRVSKRPTP